MSGVWVPDRLVLAWSGPGWARRLVIRPSTVNGGSRDDGSVGGVRTSFSSAGAIALDWAGDALVCAIFGALFGQIAGSRAQHGAYAGHRCGYGEWEVRTTVKLSAVAAVNSTSLIRISESRYRPAAGNQQGSSARSAGGSQLPPTAIDIVDPGEHAAAPTVSGEGLAQLQPKPRHRVNRLLHARQEQILIDGLRGRPRLHEPTPWRP